MNSKRAQLDKIKAQTYKLNGNLTLKTPKQIEKELSVLQGSDNQSIMNSYRNVRKGV